MGDLATSTLYDPASPRELRQRLAGALALLDRAMEIIDHDTVDDTDWWTDLFTYLGLGAVQTDEGWEPASVIDSYLAEDPHWQPLNHVGLNTEQFAKIAALPSA